MYIDNARKLVHLVADCTPFYSVVPNSHDDAKARVQYLKDIIENKDGYRLLYLNGEPFRREEDVQLLFRLTWYGSANDVNREVNNGRGPVDFVASKGVSDKTLIEFKLASNTHLKRNLEKQVEIYEKASDSTRPSLKVIVFFTRREELKIYRILKTLKLLTNPDIVLIDARKDNKVSASKA